MLRRDLIKLFPGLALPLGLGGLLGSRASASEEQFGVGVNLSGIVYWTDEHPFRNLATAASSWGLKNRDGRVLPLPTMSDQGYPLNVHEGTYFESFLIGTPFRTHLTDTQIVQYDGIGRIDY